MLYHYSSINSLSLILKTRKLKFNRLDLVNDPLDGFSRDFIDSQKIVYVSCFSLREDDTLPMWSLYTNDMKGVRIGFPEDIFGEVEQERFGMKIRKIKNKYFNQELTFIAGPENVEYKSSIEEVNHHIIKDVNNGKTFNPFMIGKYKLDDWKFEQEVRFKVFSVDYIFGGLIAGGAYDKMLSDMKMKIRYDINEIFVDINPTCFKNIELLLGPKTTQADKIIVEALVKAYCPEISIIEKSRKMIR